MVHTGPWYLKECVHWVSSSDYHLGPAQASCIMIKRRLEVKIYSDSHR